MTLTLHPSDEQVAVAWIASIPGFTTAMAGTVLPPDVTGGRNAAAWLSTGYVTVAVAGGNPDALLPVSRPVMQVDCWAARPGSGLPPWEDAAALASAIRYATLDRVTMNRVLAISANGVTYPSASVQAATLLTAFRRIYDDTAEYARYQGDLQLSWIAPGDQIT